MQTRYKFPFIKNNKGKGVSFLKTEPEKNTVCKIRVVMEVSWKYHVAQPSKIISIDGRLQEIILARCGVSKGHLDCTFSLP